MEITAEDRRFVLDNINKRLRLPRPLGPEDVIAERCGVRPLVVKAGQRAGGDWTQLSRKHVLETDAVRGHITVFGGKLTDCLNVGEELCSVLQDLGLVLAYPERRWYGEPPELVREEYFHQARLMDLDAMTAPSASEKLSTRLWRRYGAVALSMLDAIRNDPRQAEVIIETSEYVRAELDEASRREMVVKLEDFLDRRSKIALVVRRGEIERPPGSTRRVASCSESRRTRGGGSTSMRPAID